MGVSGEVWWGREVWVDGVLRPAALELRGEKIHRLSLDVVSPPPGARDLGGAVLLPALTDTHVHLNEPGRTEWEGFETATRAAAVGGVTLMVDMPLNSDPVTTSLAALQTKQATAALPGKLWVDVGFWGGVVPGNTEELRPMVEAGALGFKCFLCHSGIDEFPASTAADLRRAMPVLREAKVPLLVHAELESALDVPVEESPAARRLYQNYLHSRPKEWEDRAVAMVVDLVQETGCRAHIVHLSSAGALPILRAARARGLPITAETCPHYLGLTAEEVPDGDTAYKCAPPIRERDNREQLWEALADGTLDFVVTDHSPCIPSLKLPETGDFLGAWGGIASLQLGLRSVWTEARRRGVPLATVVRWMSTGTAGFLGAAGRGRIAAGMSADLLVFHPEDASVLRPESVLHRHAVSPWIGRRLYGRVSETWSRGRLIARDGQVEGVAQGRVWAERL